MSPCACLLVQSMDPHCLIIPCLYILVCHSTKPGSNGCRQDVFLKVPLESSMAYRIQIQTWEDHMGAIAGSYLVNVITWVVQWVAGIADCSTCHLEESSLAGTQQYPTNSVWIVKFCAERGRLCLHWEAFIWWPSNAEPRSAYDHGRCFLNALIFRSA